MNKNLFEKKRMSFLVINDSVLQIMCPLKYAKGGEGMPY